MSNFIRPWDTNESQGQEQTTPKRSLFDNIGDALTAMGANFTDVRATENMGDLREQLFDPYEGMSEEEYYQKREEYKRLRQEREAARQQYAQAHQNLVNDDSFLKNIDQMGGTLEGMAAQGIGTAVGAGLGALATGGAGIGVGAKMGNAAGAVAGGYLDARSVALQAEEEVLDAGGTWEQAKQAYDEALKKASLTTLPETLADIAMGNRLVRAGLSSGVARKIAGSTLGRAGSAVLDPAARLGTKAAFASGKGLVGRGVGLATDIALQGATEAGQEVTQDYIANREVAKALGQQDNEYSLGGFKDFALSPQGLETMKTAGIMGALFGGVGGAVSSGQYLTRGAETNRGIQTRNVTEKMIQDGSLEVGEEQRQKLEKFISDEKGYSIPELASWSDSEIIAEASILEGRKHALENKTGEKENLSTIRGAVNIINRIYGNESTNISVNDLTPQAREYLDIIGVADDMREQMFKPTSKALVVAKLSGDTIESMKQNEGKTIKEVIQDEKTKQLPHRQVPLLGRPQPNFTMGEGTASRYTGNPNFVMYDNETPGINVDNIQNATNREVIDMARQTQNDSPYGSTRQSISEEMTRRGLNLGDENREVGQYTGEPYTGSRDVTTQGRTILNNTTADALAAKIFERYKENPRMVGAALDNVFNHVRNEQDQAFAENVARRVLGRMNGYYGGQTQFEDGVAYAGYTEPQQEVRGEPIPAEGQKTKRSYRKRNTQPPPTGTSFAQNLTTPAESDTVEKNEGGQNNGQTENTRGTEDLRRVDEQQRPDGRNVRQESLQGRGDQEDLAGRKEGTGNSEQRVLNGQEKEPFGRQIIGKIPKALKQAWAGLGCQSKIEDWRVVSGKKEYLQLFSDALSNSIKNNRTHGVYVDPMSVEDLEGATVILHKSKKAGLAIDRNGTLHGVFKDPSLKIPKVVRDITLIAREMGCVRMDCYGGFLVRGYQTLGFTPVAKLNFNEEYVEHDDAHATMLKERPDVYDLVRNEDSNEVARNKIANKEYVYMSDKELSKLPTFEDYDGAISYGDSSAQIKKKVGDKFNNTTVVWATEDARKLYNEIKNEPQSVINEVLKRVNKRISANKDTYGYPFLVELQKNLTKGQSENNQKLNKQEMSAHVDNINKKIDEYLNPEFEEYSEEDKEHINKLDGVAKYFKKSDKELAKQKEAEKNAKKKQENSNRQQKKQETNAEYIERREKEIEQEVDREIQNSTTNETLKNNPSENKREKPKKTMSDKERQAYIRKKFAREANDEEMVSVYGRKPKKKEQSVKKNKTESDNVVDGWIERLTSNGNFDFNEASITLYELLDKGNITEKEYDKIMNGLMEYAEGQEENVTNNVANDVTTKEEITKTQDLKPENVTKTQEFEEEHYWDKYRNKDGIIENEKEGVYQDGKVDEPLFADWKEEDEVPTDGQDYIYILCGNYDVSNKILANLKARIKKEMNSKHPRGDMEFLNDAYDEITEEQNSRAENDERISVEDNTCPWTSEMIFDNMLEQAQYIESQNENESSEFLKQSGGKSNTQNSIYESLTEEEKKKVDSVNNVDGIKDLSEHGKIVFFEALQTFKQAKNKLVSKLDVENAIVFARMCERIASLYNSEANLEKIYNAKMVADQITIELDVVNNKNTDYGESGIIWNGKTPTLKSVTDRIIRIFSKPSPTTFIHEATHIYNWELELISKESPNGQAAKDLQALRKWAHYMGKERELNNIKNITSDQQGIYTDLINDIENAKSEDERNRALRNWEKEKIARGFEEYLRTKSAPVSGLKSVFKRFKNWIASFWKDMRGLSVSPSKEVQEVFDRMILTDPELRKKYGNTKMKEGENQNGGRVVERTDTRNEEALQHKAGSRRGNEGNSGLNGTRKLDQSRPQGIRSKSETKSNDRQNRKGRTKNETNKTLTDRQIEAMDKREEKEYNKRQERITKADEAGELSDVVKDVYSVTFTESARGFAENRTRMEYFDNREKYWKREEDDNGNVTYTRKTPFEHHQKEVTYDGANGFTKEDKKKSKPAQWLEWAKDQLIKYAFNDMHFLAKAARKLGKYDAYVKMIVTKGYALKANTAMQRGIKYNGKYTRALNDIIKEIGEEKQKDFIEYCIAKRVIDLSKRDIPVYQDMKPDEAADLIKKYESGADAKLFMKNQKDFVEYNKALLHVLVDSGIHTEEEFQKLIEVDPNFVPLSKVMDDADMGFNSIQVARSVVNVKTPLKRIGTSLRKVKNPFLEMQKRTAEYYAIASRNKAGQIFVNEIANALDKKANGDTIAKGQGMIRQVRVDEKDGNLITKPDDKQQIIYVCNNGKHEFYQVSDPEIYRALKALDADQMGTIQKMIDPFLHAPSALIRETATMVPDFGVRNLLRDGGEAFLTSEHGFLPFIDQIWGMYQMANNTEWYQRFLEQKGEYGTYNRENANDGVARIEDTIDEKVNPIKNFNEIRNAALQKLTNKKNSKATRAVALLQLMGSMPYAVIKSNKRINDYLEMGTRVGEFKNAKMGYNGTLDRLSRGGILDWNADINKARQDDILAAGAAKEITLNFEQYGIIGKQLNRYIPFFNATLQGIYKMCNALELMATGTTLSGQKNRTLQGELLFKAALITAIGVGVAAAGEGDDDYEEANQYEKENFWILPNGLRFPKDQVLGKLFGNVAEKSYTQWRKGKFEPSDILRSIKENFTPDKFIPALAEIALGGMYNYDTFYKSAIVPEYMQGKLGHLQKDLATSNMASDVSDFLWKYTKTDISAKRLDWALQKNLTNCKKYIDAIYDLGKKAYDPKSFNEKMARGYDKNDSTGSFVGGLKDDVPKPLSLITGTFATNRTNYKSISDFYEKYNDLKKLATDEQSMSKEDKRAWKRYEQAYKKDKNFRKQLRAIKSDSSLTGKQKREKADKIFKQQIKLAKWAEG